MLFIRLSNIRDQHWRGPVLKTKAPLQYLLTGSQVPEAKIWPPMSSVVGEKMPAKMASRSWSTNTLKRGVGQVMLDVKSEPWAEDDDERLQARLKVGLPLFPSEPTDPFCTLSIPPLKRYTSYHYFPPWPFCQELQSLKAARQSKAARISKPLPEKKLPEATKELS